MPTIIVMKKLTNKRNAALPSCSINHCRGSQRPHFERRSACLPRHPAVAYLLLVRLPRASCIGPGYSPRIGRRLPGPFLQAQHILLPANGSAKAVSVLFENLEDCRDSFFARPVPLEFYRIRQRADGDGPRLHHALDS
jgi:hypothetical protein